MPRKKSVKISPQPSFSVQSIVFGIYFLFLASILYTYFTHYPVPGIFSRFFSLMAALSFFFASGILGQEILTRFKLIGKPIKSSSLWIGLYSVALGVGIVGSVVLLVGWLLPVDLKISLQILAVLFFLFPLFRLKKIKSFIKKSSFNFDSQFSLYEIISIILVAIGIIPAFISCFTPITYYDSLVYHLALPVQYLREGQIQSIPYNLYSHFPALAEMIFLFVLNQFSDSESVINLILFGLSLGISLGLGKWVSELTNRSFGLFAMALWWLMPAVQLLSIGAYVEIPLAFYIFLAVRLFVNAELKASKNRSLFLTGLLAGFACSVKYTGALGGILLGIGYLVFQWKNVKRYPKGLFIFGIGMLLPFSIWLFKNFIEIGNPVFPFFYQYLGGHEGWSNESAASYFSMLTEYNHKSVLLFQVLLAPWNFISKTLSFGGGFDVLGDFGWPLILSIFPLGLFFLKGNRTFGFLWVFGFLYFLGWLVSKPVLRFLIGGLPIFVLISTLSLFYLNEKKKRLFGFIVALFIIPFLFSNQFMYYFLNQDLQLFSVSMGLENRHDYLNRRLDYHSTFQKINFSLKKDAKILLIGENRSYHLKVTNITTPLFTSPLIAKWANEAQSGSDLENKFSDNKISHILINRKELSRLGGLENFGFDHHGIKQLEKFIESKTTRILGPPDLDLHMLNRA